MKNTLHVIIDKINTNQNFYKNKDVFTLNEFVLSDKEKKLCNHLFPNPRKTALEAEELILKTSNYSQKIIDNLKNKKICKSIKDLDELLITFLEIKISRLLYMKSIIPQYKEYILIDKKNKYFTNSKNELLLKIEKIYAFDKNNICSISKFCNYKFNLYNIILLKIQEKLLQKILRENRKEINFFSDQKAYFIEFLKEKINNKNNWSIYYSGSRSYLKIFQILLKQLFYSLFKNQIREIGIFLLPKNNIYYDPYEQILEDDKDFEIDCLGKKLSSYLGQQIYSYLLNSISYKNYLFNIFKESKIKSSFFHSVRFPDLFSFSRTLNEIKSNCFLISHGSHTIQKKNRLDIISSEILGVGMAFSKDKNIKLLSQSEYCDDFLDSMKLSYFKINRLLNKNIQLSPKNKTLTNKIKTKILLVGTVKQLGARRYYVESSAEFFESVLDIYKKLIKHKELFEITVSIRNLKNEINANILENAFKNKKNLINMSKGKSIYEEIKNCDCLISFSSTTLEEGLIMNKPVMCYGLPRYNHLKLYEKKNQASNYEDLNKNLKIIEKSLGKKFIFKSSKKRKINFKFK